MVNRVDYRVTQTKFRAVLGVQIPGPKGGLCVDSAAISIFVVILVDLINTVLSSPCAESARANTGRRNSHSGRGEDFLSRQPNFFTETAVTPEQKVKKWFPTWEINRHAEG